MTVPVRLTHRVVRRYETSAPSGPASQGPDLAGSPDDEGLLVRMTERVAGTLRAIQVHEPIPSDDHLQRALVAYPTSIETRPGCEAHDAASIEVAHASKEPAPRVHKAAVVLRDVPDTRVEYSKGGRISAVELARMLAPTLGFVTNVRFRPSLTGTPNTVSWEALGPNGEVVTGKIVIHAGVSDVEVVTWAEVDVDPLR